MEVIKKFEIAAQIVALMRATFDRPDDEEMFSVLRVAKEQIRDATQIAATQAAQELVSYPVLHSS
jgi:hypothetical protein